MATVLWGFWYFVFLKVFTSIFAYESYSLVGSAVFAIVLSLIDFIPARAFNSALNSARGTALALNPALVATRARNRLWRSYVLALALALIAVVLIAKGFSERFFDRVLTGGYRDVLGLDWSGVTLCLVAVILMTLPNMIMVHSGLRAIEKGRF